jgi:polysaccharide deacetylase family protein (PEP-CTERM system associated)
MMNNRLNVLTFDVEDWYHCTFYDLPEQEWLNCEARVEPQLDTILRILKKTDNKATFFTVASLVRRSPEIIKRIAAEGHELALHSYSHKMLTEQSEDEFENDLKISLETLATVSEQKIAGFRAPYWSVNEQNKNIVVGMLRKFGFLYDSSIFPFKTFQYGDSTAPCYPYVLRNYSGDSIYEIPPSILKLSNIRIPFSGGFYFRVLPYALITAGIRKANKEGYPAVLYFHPYDIDPEQPKTVRGFRERIILYSNLRRGRSKFERLLHEFRFGRMDEYVKGLSRAG